MAAKFLGNIMMFAGNFEIKDNAFCNGQLISIAQNTALFSILGTNFGGNGTSTFALPDLRKRCPIGAGIYLDPDTNELINYPLGQAGGLEMVSLSISTLPAHDHDKKIQAAISSGGAATTSTAQGSLPADTIFSSSTSLYSTTAGAGLMAPMSLNLNPNTQNTGDSLPHSNMQPFQTLNFIVALRGVFPSRN